ncbi:unnamed protein product [Rhizophagus irregularis]|nr:unnamed protein product [Rhizophagus irregularis]CAB5385560.1 unnamed protein product [Rhizophagus irregularis]
MKKQEKQTDKRRQSSDSRSSRGPFVLSVDGEIRQTPSNRQTEQTSSITPSNRQTTSTPSNHQTEQTSSITPSNRQTEQTSSITPSNHLKSENAILRAQNEQLRQQVNEITKQLQTVTSKFNSSQEENQTLLMINNEFGRKNDKLYESLE